MTKMQNPKNWGIVSSTRSIFTVFAQVFLFFNAVVCKFRRKKINNSCSDF